MNFFEDTLRRSSIDKSILCPPSSVPCYDIIGFGTAAFDTIMELERFPAPGGKTRVLSRENHGGGLTATALFAAAKLGAKCYYDGPLGENEMSDFIRERLRQAGVDVPEPGRYMPATKPFDSMIFLEKSTGERTIFWSADDTVLPEPDEKTIERALAAKVLFADHNFAKTLLSLYRKARQRGMPIVGDFETIRCSEEKEAFELVDHPILPAHFAREYAKTSDIEEAVRIIAAENHRQTVVVTDGENGSWFIEQGENSVRHHPAFPVTVIDTTGCGDVYHGAYAAALAFGWDLPCRIRFASAAAALKTTGKGGQNAAPTREKLDLFLKNQSPLI